MNSLKRWVAKKILGGDILRRHVDALLKPIERSPLHENDQPKFFDYDDVPAKLIAFYFPQFHPLHQVQPTELHLPCA